MRILVSCIDFTTQRPVDDCLVTCRVLAAPRFESLVAPPQTEPPFPPILMASDQIPGRDNDDPVRRIILSIDKAIELPVQTATTGSSGNLVFQFNVAAGYELVKAAHGSNPNFYDSAVLVALGGDADGLRRQSLPILSSNSTERPDGEIDLKRLLLMDFAKTIVGHTTENTTKLWFQLHGTPLPDRSYTCNVYHLGPDGRPNPSQPLQDFSLDFDPQAAMTTVVEVTGLAPGEPYGYELVLNSLGAPGTGSSGRVLCDGAFRTAREDEDDLTILFGSCHKPLDMDFFDPVTDLKQWRHIANRSDGDLLLLMGDQMYGDAVREPSGSRRWFDGYVERYNAYWAFQPLRQALSRRPTYMTLDDHEVADGWGVNEWPAERVEDAKLAFRIFQLSHSPSGFAGPVHYSFRRGPAAFFLTDSRTARGSDRDFPILGPRQWERLRAWAVSNEAREADIIIFVSPVPIALMPVEKLREIAEAVAARGAVTAGTLIGAGIGALVGGAGGALAGMEIGAIVGAAGAAIAYPELEEEALVKKGVTEMWAFEPNQDELVRVLDLLFGLANDIQLDGSVGEHRRAVFILSGDAHFALAHVVASNQTGDNGRDHSGNPQLMQFMSSAIGRSPQSAPEILALFEDLNLDPPELDSIATDLIGLASKTVTRFVLDDKRDHHYRAAALGAVFERNFGSFHFKRVDERRRYQFEVVLQGEENSIVEIFEVNLDARPVTWQTLKGQIISVEGRPSLLRVHELGGGFGPSFDRLDAEVILQLDSQPSRSFGFQLRRDTKTPEHVGMLDTLRTAFNRQAWIRLDYRRTGVRNGQIIRVTTID